jgi:hypothetical protein
VRASTLTALLGLPMIVAIACGGRQKPDTTQDKRAEIIALWTQIRDWRMEAKMDLDPDPATLISIKGQSVKNAQRVCPDGHAVPTTCNDVCNLADAICDNAERICDIAAELGPTDKLGVEKCESAKGSCKEAKQRCCSCSEPTKASFAW